HARGDGETSGALIDEAAEVDAMAVQVIKGGIIIGEIPDPDRDWPEWVRYVARVREALAAGDLPGDLPVLHTVYCRGCQRAWYDGDDCTCFCDAENEDW